MLQWPLSAEKGAQHCQQQCGHTQHAVRANSALHNSHGRTQGTQVYEQLGLLVW